MVICVSFTTSAKNLTQDRTANKVNEIADITETTGPSWVTPAYSLAGNMTTVPQPADLTASYAAAFDAWNRLVKLTEGANTVQENEYDGLRRRMVRKDYVAGSLDETRHFYYSQTWQVLEERLGTSADPDRQFVWGLRYIDDLVCRDRDTTGDGTLDERLYALQDANWNVTALADVSGDVQERYAYQAYGQPLFLDSAFVPQAASSFDWETLFAGYRWDQATGIYVVRNRELHPALGVWIERDTVITWNTFNLYQYTLSLPTRFIDPTGLISEESADSDDGDDKPADPCCDCKKAREDYFTKHGNTYQSEKADRTCRVNISCKPRGCGGKGATGCGLTEGPRQVGGKIVIKVCVSCKCGAPNVILAHELAHMRDFCDGEMNRNCGECFKFEKSGAEAGCKEAKKTNKDLDVERCIQCAVNISCGARFGSMCQPYPEVDPKKCTCADLGVPPGCGI